MDSSQDANAQTTQLKVSNADSVPQYQMNILPCRIKHTGPVDTSNARYWKLEREETAADAAPATVKTFFRGRELHGKSVALSASQFQGVVLARDEQDEPNRKNYSTIGKFDTLNSFHNGNDTSELDQMVLEWLLVSALVM